MREFQLIYFYIVLQSHKYHNQDFNEFILRKRFINFSSELLFSPIFVYINSNNTFKQISVIPVHILTTFPFLTSFLLLVNDLPQKFIGGCQAKLISQARAKIHKKTIIKIIEFVLSKSNQNQNFKQSTKTSIQNRYFLLGSIQYQKQTSLLKFQSHSTFKNFTMSLQILPSQQLLLLSAVSSKQQLVFDPKTTSVLSKYHDDQEISPACVFYQNSKQIIAIHNDRTFLTIWDYGVQQPCVRISLSEVIDILWIKDSIPGEDDGFLYGGSANGVVYVWQLPSGILLKKFSAHSSSIKLIQHIDSGYIITASQNELKLWSLYSLLIQQGDSIPQQTTHLPTKSISSLYHNKQIFTLHKTTICIYNALSLKLKDIIEQQVNGPLPTCMCLSKATLYVGTENGKISEYLLHNQYQSQQLTYEEEKFQIHRTNRKKKQIRNYSHKYPISTMKYIESLGLLATGSAHGQLTIWENGKPKKSLQLFKTAFKNILVFHRPQLTNKKISTNNKIKALHKYQNSKTHEPIQMGINNFSASVIQSPFQYENFQTEVQKLSKTINYEIMKNQQNIDKENKQVLAKMMENLRQPYELLNRQIEILREERDRLIEQNLKYANIITKLSQNKNHKI